MTSKSKPKGAASPKLLSGHPELGHLYRNHAGYVAAVVRDAKKLVG
jgi:hypothetical protein